MTAHSGVLPDESPQAAGQTSTTPHLIRERLSLEFLIFSTVVVAAAMVLLGAAVSYVVGQGIVRGVAETATASVVSFITHSVDLQAPGQLSDSDRKTLDQLVLVAGEAASTRLLDVRIWRPDGTELYSGTQPLDDRPDSAAFAIVTDGGTVTDVISLTIPPVGPVSGMPLRLLRVYAPVRDEQAGDLVAVAAFYFGTRALAVQQSVAQQYVWIAVMLVGIVVVGVLFAFVASIDRRLVRQEHKLVETLGEANTLAAQNETLREESERLRLDAIEANESLLARVGADIHDGPLQVLTLVQLRLARLGEKLVPAEIVEMTRKTMEELRTLSVGLVLPELENATLAETIELAVARHRAATGTRADVTIDRLPEPVALAVRTAVYRIVQQSLTNAVQHADGRGQSVTATLVDDHLQVEIRSSRKAHAPRATSRPRLGMRGMQLRAEATGGQLETEFGDSVVLVRFTLPRSALGQETQSDSRGRPPAAYVAPQARPRGES